MDLDVTMIETERSKEYIQLGMHQLPVKIGTIVFVEMYLEFGTDRAVLTYMCELERWRKRYRLSEIPSISFTNVSDRQSSVPSVVCAKGYITLSFLACDSKTECWGMDVVFGKTKDSWDIPSPTTCQAPLTSLPPSFACSGSDQRVPYSLVCDHFQDCQDNSDEEFCTHPACYGNRTLQCGTSKQCIPETGWCDYKPECYNGWDELDCKPSSKIKYRVPRPPIIVKFPEGRRELNYLADINECPETHFRCPGDEMCMPVFVRCNEVYDCPGKEDEDDCSSFTCPGFFRCRSSTICLHPHHVCDQVYQCPSWDDEMLCDLSCPPGCTCYGLAFNCSSMFEVHRYPDLRYLLAIGTGMTPQHLIHNLMLIHLSLASCDLSELITLTLPNLHSLDLSNNTLTDIRVDQLRNMTLLRALFLANNAFQSLFSTNKILHTFPALNFLDLSGVLLEDLDVSAMSPFSNLAILNLTDCKVTRVASDGFQTLTKLTALYMNGCPMDFFQPGIFAGLNELETLHSTNYKLCCSALLPKGFNPSSCHSPFNEISSCDALLGSNVYRIALAIFATLSVVGNLCSFVFRLFFENSARKSGFGVFVANLCVSDFLMGVYLVMIGLADQRYLGSYLWDDVFWRQSVLCKMAGFISLLSSEVSAFIVCLITLDRFLVLRFPFSHLHFHSKSASLTCAGLWIVGMVLVGLPLLPAWHHWRFYGSTSICLPLPITRFDFAGHDYAFGLMIVLNFVLFLLIAAGQLSIFLSVRSNSMLPTDSQRKSRDLDIARRLITIALSDFVCWFPIGLLGLLAARGTAIPGEVNVGMAIFVLPINSALNPFLYTVNIVLERQRKAREEKIVKLLEQDMNSI